MSDDIKQIGQRLKGLREVLNIPIEQMAEVCETTVEHYLKMESGESDPSVYRMSRISKRYGIALDVLLFGEEPRVKGYYVTRAGQGPTVERHEDYQYQSLASGFSGRQMEPFFTHIDPLPEGKKHHLNSHEGQEFNYVLSGTLEYDIDGRTLVLEKGDSIYFDAKKQHSMNALGDETVELLVVII